MTKSPLPRSGLFSTVASNMHFPAIPTANLQRQRLTAPTDLEGRFNLALIAFRQWHQGLVDTWLDFARALEAETAGGVKYYEFPTISARNSLAQLFINEGMRAGIRNSTARERTMTLYVDMNAFLQALEIEDVETIYALLIDRAGAVWWRARGPFQPEKGLDLRKRLAEIDATHGPL